MTRKTKRKSQRLSRRKDTLLKKAHEIAFFCDIDVALVLRIRKTGRLIMYNSIDLESWPPSKEQIQSHYPLPVNLLPRDIEAKYGKPTMATSGVD
ncbi:hypothetical protein HYALB_00013834 [Hymenoscyphus albidus]|uniref:MADS-box domain-containing protein n=1 Tax=Hymenoscyphus albidus TaxID=595503 RepID=A0A9N9M1V7_9HELO|nr:hypothetical protein HYALB_00013834 [Hymenoscyphus albidus]